MLNIWSYFFSFYYSSTFTNIHNILKQSTSNSYLPILFREERNVQNKNVQSIYIKDKNSPSWNKENKVKVSDSFENKQIPTLKK